MSSTKLKLIFEYVTFVVFCIVLVFAVLELTGKSDIWNNKSQKTILLGKSENLTKRAYISGAVEKPGVYEIEEGMLIIDLVDLAGSFSSEADLSKIHKDINLASRIFHQDHIYIPSMQNQAISLLNTTAQQTDTGKINLNTATSQELETLPGVGPSTASKIIEARPYADISGLLEVKGIGDATFAKLKDLVTV